MRSATKQLRFPLGGLAKDGPYRDSTYPNENSVYATPKAVNVIGECSFSGRRRGGSRPGLKPIQGVSSSATARWLWPNGEPILWPSQPPHWELSGDGDTSGMSVFRFGGVHDEWYLLNAYGAPVNSTSAPEDAESLFFDKRSAGGAWEAPFDVTANLVGGEGGGHMVFSTADSSTMPDGSRIFLQHPLRAIYRDRLVKAEGSVWMASRTGDFGDFDFGRDSDQPTRAVAGNLAVAGDKGETITALAPFGDSRLFVATSRRLAVIQGEPTAGLATLSEHVGIVSADAWCNAEGALYFMGQNGLYAVGDGSPILVSQKIPEDLKGLASAVLVYDPHYRGIHVLAPSADYFYDIEAKAFWPQLYPAAIRPQMGGLAVVDGVNRVVFRCADGAWRCWDDDQLTDDGVAIQSSVVIGPFKCGVGDTGDGMLDALTVTLAGGSAPVGVSIRTAKSAEAAVASGSLAATQEFTFAPGWNRIVRPRRRGAWCCIELSSTGRWAYESVQADVKQLGRLRP